MPNKYKRGKLIPIPTNLPRDMNRWMQKQGVTPEHMANMFLKDPNGNRITPSGLIKILSGNNEFIGAHTLENIKRIMVEVASVDGKVVPPSAVSGPISDERAKDLAKKRPNGEANTDVNELDIISGVCDCISKIDTLDDVDARIRVVNYLCSRINTAKLQASMEEGIK